MLLIPAIDLRDGSCVRLEQGDFEKVTVYSSDPLEVALRFAASGATLLHLVDLDGARLGAPQHLSVLARIARDCNLKVEFGGGLRTIEAIEQAIAAGATRVVLGTAVLEDPDLLEQVCEKFGSQIVVGIDARDGLVATRGWLHTSSVSATDLAASVVRRGARRIIYTDIATDGMLSGPNVPAVEAVIRASGVPVVASAGVTSVAHLHALSSIGAEAAIVGKALYTGDMPLSALREWQ
jgi:phosphoribosylformimino-5-aminoimidazole carboxamide ribotide isomerase